MHRTFIKTYQMKDLKEGGMKADQDWIAGEL